MNVSADCSRPDYVRSELARLGYPSETWVDPSHLADLDFLLQIGLGCDPASDIFGGLAWLTIRYPVDWPFQLWAAREFHRADALAAVLEWAVHKVQAREKSNLIDFASLLEQLSEPAAQEEEIVDLCEVLAGSVGSTSKVAS